MSLLKIVSVFVHRSGSKKLAALVLAALISFLDMKKFFVRKVSISLVDKIGLFI
jgi:hypothetical protein